MRRELSWTMAAAILLAAGSAAAQVHFPSLPLDQVRRDIAAKGAQWTAGENGFTRLPADVKARYRGGLILSKNAPRPAATFFPTYRYAMPSRLDWRSNGGNFVTGVRDQSQCGGCWSFASVGALESKYLITSNAPGVEVDFSEQILISCDSGNMGCNGGYLDAAATFLQDQGTYTESCYEFQAQDTSCGYACSEWSSGQGYFKIGGWQGVAQDVNELKAAVYANGPIAVGMIVCDDMEYYNGGVYTHASGSCPQDAGHAVLLVGYDDAQQAFIVKNSYNEYWGDQGYFKIAYAEVSGGSEFGAGSVAYTSAYGTDDTVRVTVATSPPGLKLTVDGVEFAAPKTFSWFPKSSHPTTLQGQKSADGKTFYDYHHRSDGLGATEAIVAPSADGTVTFFFDTQYRLLMQVNDPKMGGLGPSCLNGCYYTKGEKVTLSANAAPGYQFDAWSGDVTSSQNPYELTITKPVTVKANFKAATGKTYVIAASAGSGGVLAPSGTVSVPAHGAQTFKVSPAGGHRITDVQVDGKSAGAIPSYTFKDVTGDHTIRALFAKTGGGTDGGSGGADTGGVHDAGGGTTDTGGGTPDAGGGGGEVEISLSFTGGGSGSVRFTPGDRVCRGSCDDMFPAGTAVTLTATPSKGTTFNGWHWGHCGRGTICSFTANGDMKLSPEFVKAGGDGQPEPVATDDQSNADPGADQAQSSGGCSTIRVHVE